jgi:anthranilate synthase/indole-3-glycerol phosphate synthase/phosphoribosylanthranilate isomerase
MRTKDPTAFIIELFSIPDIPSSIPHWRANTPLVKICGIRTEDEALAIAGAGADLLSWDGVRTVFKTFEKARVIFREY